MNIKVKIDGVKEATEFSNIMGKFPYETYLRSGEFCIDAKSMIGVLAIFYSAKDTGVFLDTNDMEDAQIKELSAKISKFIVK